MDHDPKQTVNQPANLHSEYTKRPGHSLTKAPIGKAPIGKAPIGKAPIGKAPIGHPQKFPVKKSIIALHLDKPIPYFSVTFIADKIDNHCEIIERIP